VPATIWVNAYGPTSRHSNRFATASPMLTAGLK
jgi:hypothetical protein